MSTCPMARLRLNVPGAQMPVLEMVTRMETLGKIEFLFVLSRTRYLVVEVSATIHLQERHVERMGV